MDKKRDIEFDEPSAATLVLDLLSACGKGPAPVQALARAGDIMGIGAAGVRVALTRLLRQGRVVKADRGAYALRPEGNPFYKEVESWFDKESRLGKWAGGWLVLHDAAVSRGDKTAWRHHVRAVKFCGFRVLSAGMAVRPDNLHGGAKAMRTALARLGMAPDAIVCAARDFDADVDARMRKLWDVAEIEAGYRDLMRLIECSRASVARKGPEAGACETMAVGRALIRAIVHDPLLPEAIQPPQARRALIEATRSYQADARELWRQVVGY